MRPFPAAAFLMLAACAEVEPAENNATESSDASPMIYAMATDKQVSDARSAFERCAASVVEMNAALKGGGIGKAFNVARGAKDYCQHRFETITDIANEAKTDFRISDCRQAAAAGSDFADGQMTSMNAPTAENQGRLETLKSGYEALAANCRTPDEYLLSLAVRG